MKKMFVLLTALTLTLALFTLGGCGKNPNLPDNPEKTESPSESVSETGIVDVDVVFTENGSTKYSIITPSDAAKVVLVSASRLQSYLKSSTGVKFEVATDSYDTADKDYKFPQYEILVGRTNRPESEEFFKSLAYDDYVIAVKNDKLIIVGGNDDATMMAADVFAKTLTSGDLVLKEGIINSYTHDYGITSLKIGDADVSKYKVIYQPKFSSRYLEAAEKFVYLIKLKYGITLECEAASSESDDAYEIVFGDCGAKGYSDMPVLSPTEVCIYRKGNKVFVGAGGDYAMSCYAKSLYREYINKEMKGEVTLEISEEIKKKTAEIRSVELEKGATLRIMTSNILGDSTLKTRSPLIVGKILDYYPDIVGLQECSGTGHINVVKKLSDLYGTGNTIIDGSRSVTYTPILYRLDKFKLVESGVEFFRKRYTATDTKTMAWVVLEELESGRKIIAINAHYSLILDRYNLAPMTDAKDGAEWRKDNSAQIIEKAASLKEKYGENTPVFIMGDLNSPSTTESIKMLENVYDDAMTVATVGKTTGINSFHGNPGTSPSAGRPIDYIFVDSSVTDVYRHKIPSDSDTIKMSDHCPVIVDVSLK